MEEPSATPVIGHDHEIVGAKQIGVGLEDVVDAVTAGSLFVGNKNQAKGEVGGDALRLQFLRNEQAANDGLLIVLHATATDLVAVDDNLPRIGLPVGKLSRRHNVHMPQNPEPTRRRAGDARDHIGAHAVGDPRVGRVNAQDVRYAELTQQPFQIQGFGHFAVPPFSGPRAGSSVMRVWYSMTLSRCCPMDSISREKRVICSSCTASENKKGGRRSLPLPWENALPKDGRSQKNCGAYPRAKRFRTA